MAEENKTQTLDDSTTASDPGQIKLSMSKFRVLRPDLFGLSGILISIRKFIRGGLSERIYAEEHLQFGDSRAAVVIAAGPLLIAAYTDELDCIALLRFPDDFTHAYTLSPGERLLTVNTYKDNSEYDSDLIIGPRMLNRWSGFYPLIAEFLTDDQKRLAERKSQINEKEWRRAEKMGRDYLKRYPGVARDGRPVYSSYPAAIPTDAGETGSK